jgi:hypothetical protein
MNVEQRHAAWLEADDGLFASVQETKKELFKCVHGLDESDLALTHMTQRIKCSEDEIREGGNVLKETSALLTAFGAMVVDLTSKIADLHLQISQTRLFITQEVTAHHDRIAMGLSPEELTKIQELNAFLPEGVEMYDI